MLKYVCMKCNSSYDAPGNCRNCKIPTLEVPTASKVICGNCGTAYDSSNQDCPTCHFPALRVPVIKDGRFICYRDEYNEKMGGLEQYKEKAVAQTQ